MRICFFGNLQSIHLRRWVEYFVDKKDEVHVITREPAEINNAYIHLIEPPSEFLQFLFKIPIITNFFYFLYKYFEIINLKKLIKKIRPDLINAQFLTDYGVLASELNFHPYIITCLGCDILTAPERFGSNHIKVMKKALNKADLIIVVSKYMKKKLIEMKINNEIIVNPLGVNVTEFNPNGNKLEKIKERFDNKKIIISTRNLESIYNLECLIKAFSKIVKEVDNKILLICGSGSLEKKLKKMVNELELNKYVYFLGKISHDEIPKYLRSADIYVSTSSTDGISISLLEAMGCGLIPIVSDIPGNHEVIKDNENGFIFKNNPNNLYKKINYCIRNHDDIKEEMVKSNIKKIKKEFCWKTNIELISKLYEKLL